MKPLEFFKAQGARAARMANMGDSDGAQNIAHATMQCAGEPSPEYAAAYNAYFEGYHSECNETRLTIAFRNLMRERLPADTLADIDNKNCAAGFDSSICHSQDYIDSNQVMIDALESIGLTFDCESDAQGKLIDSVWGIVKYSGFALRVLFEDKHDNGETDTPCLAFVTAAQDHVDSPASSECGRFQVDPVAHYGLTPEQVEKMRAFNGWLSVDDRP